jgi:hypothetical protein
MVFAAEPLDALHAVTVIPVPASLALDPDQEITRRIALGDSAVFSLQLESGGSVKTWFLRATVLDIDPQSRGTGHLTLGDVRTEFALRGSLRFVAQVTDASGARISESVTSRLISESLVVGFARACELTIAVESRPEDERLGAFSGLSTQEKKTLGLSMLTMNNLLLMAAKNESLGPLLREVVKSPSLVTVALNFAKGIDAKFNLGASRIWKRPTPIEVEAAFVMPVGVVAFGEPALEASMVVVRSKLPTHPCAGVVSIVGVHPDNRDVRMHLQLQALGRVGAAEFARLQLLR